MVITTQIKAGATIYFKNVLCTNQIGHRLRWEYCKIDELCKHWGKQHGFLALNLFHSIP